MPAPSRTSLSRIVELARAALSRDGVDAVTMRRVAQDAGVQAPSLYKHVVNRAALLRLLVESIAAEVGDLLEEARDVAARAGAEAGTPADQARAMARALRAFAHRDPHAFGLLFAPPSEAGPVDARVYAASVAPLLDVMELLAGRERALDAARTLTAWAAGFLTMELAGAFHLGGSVDGAYEYGMDVLMRALGHAGSV